MSRFNTTTTLACALVFSCFACSSASGPPDESFNRSANGPAGASTNPSSPDQDPMPGPDLTDPSDPNQPSDPGQPPPSSDPDNGSWGGEDPPPPQDDDDDDLSVCASDTVHAAQVQLDLMLLVDKSGSMQEGTYGGSKWDAQRNAITSFVNHPESAGIGIGMQYFPYNDSTGYPYCGVFSYANPEVPMGVLPGHAGSITNSLGWQYPEGGTPTLPALTAMLQHMSGVASSHPDHVAAVVLATDGEPTECGFLNNVAGVAGIASTYAGGNPPVLTFVIGVGSSLFSLNAIASAGGTGQAFIIDTAQDVTQQFIDALKVIQSSVACQFQIPMPAQGTPDFDQVNVQYTPMGGSPVIVPRVDPGACGGAEGWFYDNPASPNKIVLCATTCNAVQNMDQVEIQIVLGCETRRDQAK